MPTTFCAIHAHAHAHVTPHSALARLAKTIVSTGGQQKQKWCALTLFRSSNDDLWFLSLREITGKSMKSCTYEIEEKWSRDQQGVIINVGDIILSCAAVH